jgi:hypothetical protein
VLAISDEVDEALAADPSPARTAELILACGDLPFDYLGALMNALDIPLVFVPGNHDPELSGYRVSRAGLTLRAGLPARAPWPDGAVNADCRVADVASLRVAGLGGCRRYSAGPNQYTDAQFWRRAARLRATARWRGLRDHRKVDVVITHAPPRGVGDDDDDPAHRGFSALHGLVAALRPAVLLHGHTRPSGARDQAARLGGTLVRNVTGWHLLEITPGAGLTDPSPLDRTLPGPCRTRPLGGDWMHEAPLGVRCGHRAPHCRRLLPDRRGPPAEMALGATVPTAARRTDRAAACGSGQATGPA